MVETRQIEEKKIRNNKFERDSLRFHVSMLFPPIDQMSYVYVRGACSAINNFISSLTVRYFVFSSHDDDC